MFRISPVPCSQRQSSARFVSAAIEALPLLSRLGFGVAVCGPHRTPAWRAGDCEVRLSPRVLPAAGTAECGLPLVCPPLLSRPVRATQIQFPSGRVELGEDLLQAAARGDVVA